MSLGKNRHTLFFDILEGGNPETLLFLDESSYYKAPESPIVESTPPGYDRPFFTNIEYSKINVLNSSTIGISDVLENGCFTNLPDGVWKFKFKICPYDELYTIQYYLRTTLLSQTLDKVFQALEQADCDVKDDSKIQATIVDILITIASGKANAREGEAKKASALYKIASDLTTSLLDKVNERCSCA